MREILNDLESGKKQHDPMRAAREGMRTPKIRRFYKEVAVGAEGNGYSVRLDGKQALTPGRKPLILPTEEAAVIIAGEFSAQVEVIDPVSMPTVRLANTAIDGVAEDPQAVLEDILRFASSDLLCYRADTPQSLVDRQAEAWDPVLEWVHLTLGARFFLSEGVMYVDQPRESIAVLGAHLARRKEPLRLAALHVATSLTGSALLALAVDTGELDVDEAWRAAHIDEDWNIQQWGEDAEASAHRQARYREMAAAAALMAAMEDPD